MSSGALEWNSGISDAISLAIGLGGTVYISNGTIYALNGTTGDLLWTVVSTYYTYSGLPYHCPQINNTEILCLLPGEHMS